MVSVLPVSTMERRGGSTATSTTSAAIQVVEGMSLCGFRSHQYQSRGNAPTRGSIHAVRWLTDPSVVVPSAALVSVSETTMEDVDVCDDSVTEVDIPTAPSSARASVSEKTTTKDTDVCVESEVGVVEPVAVLFAATVFIF